MQEKIISPLSFSTDLDKPVLAFLDNLVAYQVQGEDAETFLQGQLSNDISAVTTSTVQLSSYSTPKGRMLAIFYICKLDESYVLITSKDIAVNVFKRLQMYIMRSKVTVNELADTTILGLSSDKQASVLGQLEFTQPDENYQASVNDDGLCFKVPGPTDRYIVLHKQETLDEKLNILLSSVYVFSHQYWQWLDILSGIPMITEATQEAFVPQMANMELIDGVSFSKGCYPGQEVVARLHYLGNANRRMFRVKSVNETGSNENITPGTALLTSEDKEIGKIITSVNKSNNETEALAVLRIEAARDDSMVLSTEQGKQFRIIPLPYTVPTEPKQKD